MLLNKSRSGRPRIKPRGPGWWRRLLCWIVLILPGYQAKPWHESCLGQGVYGRDLRFIEIHRLFGGIDPIM